MGASCCTPAFGTMSDSMSDSPVPVGAPDDIARLKRELATCRAELQAVREEQRTFAEGISHDLRAPLRAIDTFAALVEKDPGLGEDSRQHLRRVRGGAARLGGLFDALLEFSRAGRADLRLQPVDLGLVAEWLVAELRDGEPARDAQLVVEAGLEVVGDEHLMKVLMSQLLGNAWKFSRDRDHVSIRISGERIGGRLHVGVHDAGCGFDMAYVGKLSQPFQRLVGSEQGGGHGLGLAIARRIVERHGGRLSARSGPGPGASFLFDLPAASAG
jgi:signal transduction histidine kinase